MPVLSAVDLKQAVADSMQLPSVTQLPVRWDRLCQMAVDQAFRDIMGAFVAKGYTRDQIVNSDDMTPLHRLQSLYWVFVHGAGLHSFDDRWVNKLDQRANMNDPNTILDADAGVEQGSGDPSGIKFGRFKTDTDTWTRDTPI
jgi:ABC-type glucose/galactose transport system permease subunit